VAEPQSDLKVREALSELQQYLSDAIAPLVVADSIKLLMEAPPRLTADEIQTWTVSQFRRLGTSAAFPDYVYHALRKIHLLGEFTLVPNEALQAFLAALKDLVLEFCPGDDRELLRENLSRLGEAHDAFTSPAPLLHRVDTASEEGSSKEPQRLGRNIELAGRRFAQLAERLARIPFVADAGAAASVGGRSDLVAQLLALAARSASDGGDFRAARAQLHERGLDASMEQVFRALSQRLPNWAAPTDARLGQATKATTAEAMQRLVTLEEDPRESARRFQELVQAAIEQVNSGSLARAVTMFELASAILAEKKVDNAFVQGFRDQAHESLDPQRLRRFAEELQVHPMLRRALAFFPALTPESLLDRLQHEDTRERRRLFLSLIEVHGAAARTPAMERLNESVTTFGDKDSFFQRNLLYLLRRIPRPPGAAVDGELELLLRLSQLGHPLPLVKEAIANLGQLKDERAERALIARLAEFEQALLRPGAAAGDPTELSSVLDRAVFALARLGTSSAWRAVVNHGLKRQPQLGDTTARLSALAGQDLSSDPEVVHRLTEALVAEVPHKFFGFIVQRRAANVVRLIEAVAATPTAEVHSVLADIVRRFPEQEFGQSAAKALAGADVPVKAEGPKGASLAGDLELFGLPNLLQSLAQSEATGVLAISDPLGQTVGTIALDGGKLRACTASHLRGDDALFQLFERPSPGSFAFVARRDPASSSDLHGRPPRELVPLFFEGMRRYDEFQQAAALVPDYACLKPTGTKPTRPADEGDQVLLQNVWKRASAGAAALQCEADLPVDSFRVRRLLAHWVEEGSLEPR
jgi:hypothetical protein